MPFSIGIPIGVVMIISGIAGYLVTQRTNKLWIGLTIMGGLITLGTLAVIFLAINNM